MRRVICRCCVVSEQEEADRVTFRVERAQHERVEDDDEHERNAKAEREESHGDETRAQVAAEIVERAVREHALENEFVLRKKLKSDQKKRVDPRDTNAYFIVISFIFIFLKN